MIWIAEFNEHVEDLAHFNDMASDKLDEFCTDIMDEHLEDIPEDELTSDDIEHYCTQRWTEKGDKMINDEYMRLLAIGEREFGKDADFNISSSMYVEF